MADKIRPRVDLSRQRFEETYIESIFLVWYARGRPTFQSLLDVIPQDRYGRTPAVQKLADWRDKFHWNERADLLDVGVSRIIEKQAIQEKVEMLTRHAEAGKLMVDKALNYIQEHNIDKTSSAIKMLVQGVQIERTSRGLPLALSKLSDLADEKLLEEINSLSLKMPPDEALRFIGDGTEEEEKEEGEEE